MPKNTDIDKLQNSLTEALGADSLVILSSAEEDRPFLGAETLAAYATYLLVKFTTAFVKQFKKRLNKEVDDVGKFFADAVFNRLKAVAGKIKPFGDGQLENQEALAAAVASIEKLKGVSKAKALLEEAVKDSRDAVVVELKKKGFSEEEAVAKADKFVQATLSGIRK